MADLPASLLHELCGRNNAYTVRRNKGAPVVFSRDPLNLRNVPSLRNNGFYNPRAIGINVGPAGTIVLQTKTPGSANKPSKALHSNSFRASTGSRKLYRAVVTSTADRKYRSDLRADAITRASAIKHSQRAVKERKQADKPRGSRRNRAAVKTAVQPASS